MKRLTDIVLSLLGLIVFAPIVFLSALMIWRHDRQSPFYVSLRVGKDGRPFQLVKLRSMVIGADRAKIDSVSSDDERITAIGRWVRRHKLDEVPQFWNVLTGEMSLVGPRPNVSREVEQYTDQERRLLTLKPGITDFASIVFADEAEILKGARDPNAAYNQLIRPGKSRLGLFYIDKAGNSLDLQLLAITMISFASRRKGLQLAAGLLARLHAPADLVELARREKPLAPALPPGEPRRSPA